MTFSVLQIAQVEILIGGIFCTLILKQLILNLVCLSKILFNCVEKLPFFLQYFKLRRRVKQGINSLYMVVQFSFQFSFSFSLLLFQCLVTNSPFDPKATLR